MRRKGTYKSEFVKTINASWPVVIIWLFFAFVYIMVERGLLAHLDHYPATGNIYSFWLNLFVVLPAASAGGLLFAFVERHIVDDLLPKSGFLIHLLIKTLIYSFLIIVLLTLMTLMANAFALPEEPDGLTAWESTVVFVRSHAFWSLGLYIATVVIVSLFYFEIRDSLGHRLFENFFFGTYQEPREESRTFMFVDMKSSTVIAEILGHVTYFRLLKSYYATLSKAVQGRNAMIYQYAGDEMVLCWRNDEENMEWLDCFWAMKEELYKRKSFFLKKFGTFPDFKAGAHCGLVTAGEIGTVKKEIVFTGDILNTAARLQSLCAEFDAELIVSEDLAALTRKVGSYTVTCLGKKVLRGKKGKQFVYKITPP